MKIPISIIIVLANQQDKLGNKMTKSERRFKRLSLEGEAGADLVGSLVQVLGIKGGTEAEGDTRAEENVVSQSGNTTVIDLGLYCIK
jgi:hypothetical protein